MGRKCLLLHSVACSIKQDVKSKPCQVGLYGYKGHFKNTDIAAHQVHGVFSGDAEPDLIVEL